MKKIMNDPKNYVVEMLEGLYDAHSDMITYANNDLHCLVKANKKPGKVGLVTGGGSGHLPLFLGYVGDGMLDGCGVGNVFQSPTPEQIHAITKDVDQGEGVLYIYGNYNGDIFNFDMAAELAEFEDDIKVKTVIGADDVATPAPAEGEASKRRGVAGIVFVYKAAGAAADKMYSLDEVERVALKASNNVRTMGVSLTSCTVPEIGHPSFEINDDDMEMGMGIHGEPGIRREKIRSADEIVDEIAEALITDLSLKGGDDIAVLVNGLGATPLDELYISSRRLTQIMKEKNINIYSKYVGELVTSIEMAGMSISIMKLDDELKEMIDYPANTPFFKQF